MPLPDVRTLYERVAALGLSSGDMWIRLELTGRATLHFRSHQIFFRYHDAANMLQ
jgi:hypothetical protein